MKKIGFVLLIALVSISLCHSQSIKNNNFKLHFEKLPTHPLPKAISNYVFVPKNSSTDGVPLKKEYISTDLKFIAGLKNITPIKKANYIISGNSIIDLSGTKSEENTEYPKADLNIDFMVGNLSFNNEEYKVLSALNQNSVETFKYWVVLTYELTYGTKVISGNDMVFDTTITQTYTLNYPQDFGYNKNLQSRQELPPFSNKPDLDINYKKIKPDIYMYAKAILADKSCFNLRQILNNRFGYNFDYETVEFSRVKAKNGKFAVSDSAQQLFETILDSIKVNSKKENHLNWHKKSIQQLAKKLDLYVNSCLSEDLVNSFSGEFEKSEYVNRMNYNLLFAYLFSDNYPAALKQYDLVKSNLFKGFSETSEDVKDFNDLLPIINHEQTVYSRNSKFFNFD